MFRPNPTEQLSNPTRAMDDTSIMFAELLQDIKQHSNHSRELCQEFAKLKQDILKEFTDFTDHYEDGAERSRLETIAMRTMEQKQEEMEKRFDDRCQEMKETQCGILKVRVGYPKDSPTC